MRVSAIVLTFLVWLSGTTAQETLKQGDTISWRLRFFRHQHPNGT